MGVLYCWLYCWWEYACRAGTRTPFSWGETLSPKQANCHSNYPHAGAEKGEYRKRPVEVYAFPPNPWGLNQMHGNVREWCADWEGDYPRGSATDPTGPATGRTRVLRGGSWLDLGRHLRSASRDALTPGERYLGLGLRLAGG